MRLVVHWERWLFICATIEHFSMTACRLMDEDGSGAVGSQELGNAFKVRHFSVSCMCHPLSQKV